MDRHRRRFLIGAGASLALPMLPSLLGRSRSAEAAPGDGPPIRFLTIYTPNGHHPEHWMPQGSGGDFTLVGSLEPLEPFKDVLIAAHGVVGNSGHHRGHAECLTGRPNGENFAAAGGPSLDQAIAELHRGETPLPSLELGVNTTSSASGVISYAASGLSIPTISSALGGHDRIHGVTNLDPETAERRRQQQLAVIDAVIDDYNAVSSRLSSDERTLLDAHVELLSEREQSLVNPPPPVSCELPPAPSSAIDFPDITRAHIDSIVTAFKCDVTRVASLVIGNSGESSRYDFAGADDDFHEIAHGAVEGAYDMYLAANRWHAEQLAYVLEQLAAIPEGDGTVLDNTLVFWTNELGLDDFGHSRADVPLVIAGGAGGRLATGQFLDLGGVHYHDILLTLGQVAGLEGLSSFGDEGTQLVELLLS